MAAPDASLSELAIRIWKAGVRAVDAELLVKNQIQADETTLRVAGREFSLSGTGRVCVVGAGKAGAGMAAGLEEAVRNTPWAERVSGWINVPEDCVRPLNRIRLHAARPAGVNEPTLAGVEGSGEILRQVSSLKAEDLCIVLISGGGSALLPGPVKGVTLEEKLAATRLLSQSGATIQELNAVRKAISAIKGGGLARACTAGRLIALIISDVIGDPLDVIASGPTVIEPIDAQLAAEVLKKFDPDRTKIAQSIHARVETLTREPAANAGPVSKVENHIIGNNAVAIRGCAEEARAAGIDDVRIVAVDQNGVASEIGRSLARDCRGLRDSFSEPLAESRITCLLSGGEPVVSLAKTDQPRKGGRNQEVVLAAMCELWSIIDGISVATIEPVCQLLAPPGFKITRERLKLVEEVFALTEGFDEEQLLARLRESPVGRRVSASSIERVLPLLVEAGVLRIRLRDDGREVYEHTGADGIALLSGGTDGEDGPTDAAGAVLDDEILQKARSLGLDPFEYLAINNSYPFFEQCGGLLKTGPTHTNVMDVRVALIQHRRSEPNGPASSSAVTE
jgi:glycerate-2-kinase